MTYEYAGNLHVHTRYSDGYGSHDDVALAGLQAGLDFVVTTDHNIWVEGIDGYRYLGDRRLLLLTGEEIHDRSLHPQRNHLLVYEARRELSALAHDTQAVLDAVRQAGGLAFLGHPFDPAAPRFHRPSLPWTEWDVTGYTGLELWNFMAEFKSRLPSLPVAIYYAYRPSDIGRGPSAEALARWDQLLGAGKKVFAIGGADAHAFPAQLGPLKKTLFPYSFLFRAVNTHVLIEEPLTGQVEKDRRLIMQGLQSGQAFVGFDLPCPTRGFRFTAGGDGQSTGMGGVVRSHFGVTLQAHLPQRADIRLLRDGQVVRTWEDTQAMIYTTTEVGIYRVEASIFYRGRVRTWIVSNPIFVQPWRR
ncbi:MAG TPA: CehA/McbA family metallohydrolase [Anaerolineales bacterium]|nr:CehA/McbA family metallohydrolase [Anaerolineales bacterium]